MRNIARKKFVSEYLTFLYFYYKHFVELSLLSDYLFLRKSDTTSLEDI